MFRISRKSVAFIVVAVLVSFVSPVFQNADAAYPDKAIIIVCHGAAGSAPDLFSRKLIDIIGKNKWCPVPIEVQNKPGGSGAVAFTFTASKKGNPYFLQTTASNIFTTPLINRNVPDYTQFTLIARIAVDPNVIIVKSNSRFKNMQDLISYAKAHPKEVKYGGTDIGAMDHLSMAQISKKTGVQFNYVAFTAGSEVTTNVLGGRLDVVTLGVVDALPHMAAGTLRPLGLVAENRLPMWKDTPTLREQGIDVTLTVPRGMIMPGGIPAEATAFMKTMLKKATSTPEWDDYVSKNGMAHAWLEGDAFVEMGKEFIETMRPLLKEAGLLK